MHTCISSHGLKRSWRSCPRRVNASNKNTPSMHHPRRRNVTTLMVGLKKTKPVTYAKISPKSGEPQRYMVGLKKKKNWSHTQKSHPKVVNPRDIAGERKKKNIERRNSRFFYNLLTVPWTVPTRMLKWPGLNRVQIMCNTSGACHVQHVLCHVIQRDSSAIRLDTLNCIYSSFLLVETFNRWRRGRNWRTWG